MELLRSISGLCALSERFWEWTLSFATNNTQMHYRVVHGQYVALVHH